MFSYGYDKMIFTAPTHAETFNITKTNLVTKVYKHMPIKLKIDFYFIYFYFKVFKQLANFLRSKCDGWRNIEAETLRTARR